VMPGMTILLRSELVGGDAGDECRSRWSLTDYAEASWRDAGRSSAL
jgi:hypothetical protein